jgi:UDP-N-acetylmuramate-alanine ligase
MVMGKVMTRETENIEYMLNHGSTYTSGPEGSGKNILANRRVNSVAGTQGKTTTSSMTASALEEVGEDPGKHMGGGPIKLEAPAARGNPPKSETEANKKDTAFF